MPQPVKQLEQRLLALKGLLRRRRIASQKQLLDGLVAKGFDVTQASVSRDLQRLGAIKRDGRYQIPEAPAAHESESGESFLPILLIEQIQVAGPNLTVVSTLVGGAAPLGVWLDQQEWPEIIGTIAGDDTIFIATASKIQQKSLISRLREFTHRGNQ